MVKCNYENEEPPQDAEEYMEETPIEDELVEKTMIVGRKGRASFKEFPTERASSRSLVRSVAPWVSIMVNRLQSSIGQQKGGATE